MSSRGRDRRAKRRPTAPDTGHGSGELPATTGLSDENGVALEIRQAVAKHLETQLSEVVAIKAESFIGPIPHPEHLAGYERVLPGAADRLLEMAEKQADHRRQIESYVTESKIKFEARGQWIACALATLATAGGIWLIASDKSGWGLGTIITAVAALVATFIYAKRPKQREMTDGAGSRTLGPARGEPPTPPSPPA